MKKEMKKRSKARMFLEPLLALPYGFLGIYWYENGFDVIVAALIFLLFIIVPGVLIVFWKDL